MEITAVEVNLEVKMILNVKNINISDNIYTIKQRLKVFAIRLFIIFK